MDKVSPELGRIVASYRKQLARHRIRVIAVYLFGSCARGTQHDGSDIDLIIVSPDFAKFGLVKRLETLGRAAGRIWQPIEAYGVTSEEIETKPLSPFWEYILESGAVHIAE